MAKDLVYRVKIEYDSAEAAKGAQAIDRTQEQAEESVEKTTQAIKRQQQANERSSRSTRNFQKAQSNANQTLFTFGDLLNDSQQFQFGFAQGSRAIGNNIGFAAEQFANINQRTGSWRGTLKALGSSLLGPGGIILGINAAVTAITVFGDSLFSSSEKADALNVKLKETNDFIKDLTTQRIEEFSDSFEDLAAREGALNRVLDSLEAQEQSIQRQIDGLQKITQNANIYNNLSREQRNISSSQLAQLIQRQEREGRINQLAQDVLENKLAELEAQKLINEAIGDNLREQPLAEEGDIETPDIIGQINEDIAEANREIFEAEQEIFDRRRDAAVSATAERVNRETEILKQGLKQQEQLVSVANSTRLAAERQTISALTSIRQQFAQGSKPLALGILALEKALAISRVIVDTTQKAAQATATGFTLLANPLTAGLASNAFAQAAAIKTSGAIAAAAIAAQGLAEGAGILTGNTGGGGSFGAGGSTSVARQGFNVSERGAANRDTITGGVQSTRPESNITIEANNVLPDTEFSVRSERGRKQRLNKTVSVRG